MFKKLKDKIAEEVKISPQRIQQFTQSVTDKLQQSNGNDENLFSISEDDAPPPSASNYDVGFTNVSLHASTSETTRNRRNSNSSMASDVSFLPRYESNVNAYHLQSDLDISASELEDNASTSSQQLGHVSKEQVHLAFQKAQMRYHKYRGRYTDLANHYKELERDNVKMKAVLVETQDKAIRRVSELREQCTLSQKAKADLEQALRTELDEKQIIISTLKDKVDLLQQNNATQRENDDVDAAIADNALEIEALQEKLHELKANNIVLATRDTEARTKLQSLEQSLADLRAAYRQLEEREKSNNLKFATSKLELHTELQNREFEITQLRHDLETTTTVQRHRHDGHDDLEGYENNNLKAQNVKLIEKCESLQLKYQNYESDMLKMEGYKLEIVGLHKERTDLRTLRDSETEQLKERLEVAKRKYCELQEETKHSLLGLEAKILAKFEADYEAKCSKQKDSFEKKLQQLEAANGPEDNNGGKETQFKLMQSEERIIELDAVIGRLQTDLECAKVAYKQLELNQLGLIEENNGREIQIGTLLREQAAREAEFGKEIQRMETEKCGLLKSNDILESKINSLEVANCNLKEQLAKLQEDLTNTKSTLQMMTTSSMKLGHEHTAAPTLQIP